jgi:predicted secreted protein with PEFG-CTERM motif
MVHPWMEGIVTVQAEGAEGPGDSDGGELMVDIATGSADQGERLSIDVTFSMIDGDEIEHVNYDIKATQNGEVVLDETGVHDHDGIMNHMTAPLPAAASDDAPVKVEVMFNGFGIPGEGDFTGPIGEVTTAQVVPEFGTVAMMILVVAIISIVAVTAKSRVIPRF